MVICPKCLALVKFGHKHLSCFSGRLYPHYLYNLTTLRFSAVILERERLYEDKLVECIRTGGYLDVQDFELLQKFRLSSIGG